MSDLRSSRWRAPIPPRPVRWRRSSAGRLSTRTNKALLGVDEIDAVYIATPPHLHTGMMKAALEAGKHVVCEKPLVDEPRRTAEGPGRPRHHAALKVASCSAVSPFVPRPQGEGPYRARRFGEDPQGPVETTRFPYPSRAHPWRAWKRSRLTAGGGLCMDWGAYDLDWLRFLLGELFDPVALLGTSTILSSRTDWKPDMPGTYCAGVA